MKRKAYAMAAQAWQLHENLHKNAQGVADGEDKKREGGLRAREERVCDERCCADDVVEDGSRVAPEIIPLGIKDA